MRERNHLAGADGGRAHAGTRGRRHAGTDRAWPRRRATRRWSPRACAALRALAEEAKRREIESLLSGEADANDAYVEINAGTGGTEAQDWAEMLMRMYMRWAEQHGYKVQLMEQSEGEQAGIKSATLQVERAERLWLAEDRGRRAPAGAHQPVRFSGAAAHQLRQRLGLSGGRRQHRDRRSTRAT